MATPQGRVGNHLVSAALGNGTAPFGWRRQALGGRGRERHIRSERASFRAARRPSDLCAEFEPRWGWSQYSGIAQLAECRTVNPLVEGSSPSTRARHRSSQPM